MSISSSPCEAALADLFTTLGSSLLQYLDEADPWTDAEHAEAKATLDRLAKSQQTSYGELADLVARRHLQLDFVTFPSEFGSLHYLALDFVIGKMIANQIAVVAACDAALQACGRDPASRLLHSIQSREAHHLVELRKLTDSFYDAHSS